jgi:DNA-binding CsgD family transcriptional regulator
VKTFLGSASARHAFDRINRMCRAESTADSGFLAELSRQLHEIIPFDGSFLSAADPLTTLATSPSRIENIYASDTCVRYWESEFMVEDFIKFRALARAERPVASLYRATAGQPARSFRYRNVNQHLNFGDELRGVFRTAHGVWGLVSLYRGDGAQPFDAADERALCELVAPIGDAFRRSALPRAGESGEVPDAPGLLMFDRAGGLESLNEPAESWLRQLPLTRHARDRADVIPVPTELLTVVSDARAIASGRQTGSARVRVLSRTGRWLVIHGFALRETGADAGRTALVIEPATATEMAPIIVKAYQLGPREQQVTALVARGLSTVEIAAELCLSTHTVRDYLKQVFEKVDVRTRGELVAKIFAEHYSTPLNATMQTNIGM